MNKGVKRPPRERAPATLWHRRAATLILCPMPTQPLLGVASRPQAGGGRRFVIHSEFQPAGDQPQAIEALVRGIREEKRDQVLTAIDNNQAPNLRGFFNRVRRLTLEGMFSDPYYGGNKNFAGWDLIRYPGPRLAVAPEDQKMSTPPKPYRRSAYGR